MARMGENAGTLSTMNAVRLGLTTLLAVGPTLTGCTSTGPEDVGITIEGTVVDEYLRPATNTGVFLVGRPMVTTDDAGAFSVSGVTPPYDVIVGLNAERGVIVYVGLTGTRPTIVLPAHPLLGAASRAWVSGTVDGGVGEPQPADHVTSVLFESPESRVAATASDGHFELSPAWGGPAISTTGTLHALQWQLASTTNVPTSYVAYGRSPALTLTDGDVLQGADLTMASPVATGSIDGTVTAPGGFTITSKALHAGFGPSRRSRGWLLGEVTGAESGFSFATPLVPDATFTIAARAAAGAAFTEVVETGLGGSATGLVLSLASPPALVTPANNAETEYRVTPFSWSGPAGAVYLVAIRYAGSELYFPPPPNYYFLTTSTSIVVPELTGIGVAPPPNSDYVWEVRAWTPVSTIDELATPQWLERPGDHASFGSEIRTVRMR